MTAAVPLKSRRQAKACEWCGTVGILYKSKTRFCSRSCSMYAREHARGGKRPIGTRKTDPNGYVKVKTENGWELEHRLVMARILDRPLLPWPQEHVHHRDGDRANNDPENLEFRTGSTHGAGASTHCPTCTCERQV